VQPTRQLRLRLLHLSRRSTIIIGRFVTTSTLVSYKVSKKHRFEAEGGEERPCNGSPEYRINKYAYYVGVMMADSYTKADLTTGSLSTEPPRLWYFACKADDSWHDAYLLPFVLNFPALWTM
jgi:hypothetical protein